LGDHEEITNTPEKIKMLNAIKFSGRTKNGLGIGVFNAITEKTQAEIRDTITLETRKEVVEPFANYNIIVLDQQFNKNSSVSLINTNVTRNGHYRDANVTGLLANIKNKRNTYGVEAQVKMSSLNLVDGNQTGFSSEIEVGKISGNYQYEIEHSFADDHYDINDLGIKFRNNYNNLTGRFWYKIFEPTEKFNILNISGSASYNRHYNPNRYSGNNINLEFFGLTNKIFGMGAEINTSIGKQYDFFESRENKAFIFENWVSAQAFVSSNYNKTFAYDIRTSFETLFEDGRDLFNYSFDLSPRLRFSDKFIMIYSFLFQDKKADRGYVTKVNDDIIFGERDQHTIINSISANYNLNTKHGLFLTFRNYWSTVTYDNNLFVLQDDGYLSTEDGYTINDIDNPNQNFNIWNLDIKYSWEFAPGSLLTALYRNQLSNNTTASNDNYFESLNTLFKEPLHHIFSIRFIYYIDYNNVKKVFNKKVS